MHLNPEGKHNPPKSSEFHRIQVCQWDYDSDPAPLRYFLRKAIPMLRKSPSPDKSVHSLIDLSQLITRYIYHLFIIYIKTI